MLTESMPRGLPKGKTGGQNWGCKLCNNQNYADRIACNKCKEPRESSQWNCHLCNNWNWLDRAVCHQCKAAEGTGEPNRKRPRPSFNAGHNNHQHNRRNNDHAPQQKNKFPGSKWTCKSCQNSNYPDRLECNRCKIDRLESQWFCSSCSNYNYMDREVCNRCKLPATGCPPPEKDTRANDAIAVLSCIQTLKPSVDCEKFIHGNGQEEEYDVVGAIKELAKCVDEMKEKYNIPKAFPPQPNMKRSLPLTPSPPVQQPLYRAPAPQKPVHNNNPPNLNQSDWIASKPGSWSCNSCGNWNFADRSECNRCKAPATNVETNRGGPITQNKVQNKPGSWECGECPNWNFPDREQCNKCKKPRDEVEVRA